MAAPWRGVFSPSPAGSTPMSSTPGSSMKSANSLVGRDDGAWSTLDHAADAQFVDAPLTQIVIREAGHFLPEESPQAVANALSEHALAHAK